MKTPAELLSQQMLRLLTQLDETIKVSIQTQSDITSKAVEALKKGNEMASEKETANGEKVIQLSKENKERFDELKSEIIRTADEITKAYQKEIAETDSSWEQKISEGYVAKSELGTYTENIQTAIDQNTKGISLQAEITENIQKELTEYKSSNNAELSVQADAIISQVEQTFVTRDELSDVEEKFESQVQQTANGITEEFKTKITGVQESNDELNQKVGELFEELDVYIRRGLLKKGENPEDNVYGIEIGRSDSNIVARFTNDRLSFIQGGNEVAYLSGNNLYITRAEILDYLKIGNDNDGYFTFDVTENGLEVRWNG